MSGNLLYLPKPSSHSVDISLLRIQDYYKNILNTNFTYILPFFSVIKGLDISVINNKPLIIFVSPGQIYIRDKGLVLDIQSKTITIDKEEDIYLIGITLNFYNDKGLYKNPLQGAPVLGSQGVSREIYSTNIVINDPNAFSIGFISPSLEVFYLDKKGHISPNRSSDDIYLAYQDDSFINLYKSDIKDYVAKGFNLIESSSMFNISPGVAYIKGKRVVSLKPTFISKNDIAKPFNLNLDTNGNILLSKSSNYIFPEVSYLYTTKGEIIYVYRPEDNIKIDIYIYQQPNHNYLFYERDTLPLYHIDDEGGINQYPIFLPSVRELKNIAYGYEYIEKKTLELNNKVNLLSGKDYQISNGRVIVLSDFSSLDVSDINYPGFTASITNGISNHIVYNSIPIDYIANLYAYIINNQIISLYPHWYETQRYYTEGNKVSISLLLNFPTFVLDIGALFWVYLLINPLKLIDINIEPIILIGQKEGGKYIASNNLLIAKGSFNGTLKLDNQVYKKEGYYMELGNGSVSQVFVSSVDIYTNMFYISNPNSIFIMITKDSLGEPDLTNVLAWGYREKGQDTSYVEINKPIGLTKEVKYHLIICTSNSLSVIYEITSSNGIECDGFSMTYVGKWVRNKYYIPIEIGNILYKKEVEDIKFNIESEVEFDLLRLNINKKNRLEYQYSTTFGNGISIDNNIYLSSKVSSIDISTELRIGEYIDLVLSDIELGNKIDQLTWISNNFNTHKPYKGLKVYIDIEEEIELFLSSNYGQGWERFDYIDGVYIIDNLSSSIGYQGVNQDYQTLSRTNIKLKVYKESLVIHPIKMINVRVLNI